MNLHVLIESIPVNPEEQDAAILECLSLMRHLNSEYKIADIFLRSDDTKTAVIDRIKADFSCAISNLNSGSNRFHQVRELIKSLPNSDILIVVYCYVIQFNEIQSKRILSEAIKEGNAIAAENLSIQAYSIYDLKMAYDQNYRPNYSNEIEVLKTFGFPINYVNA